VTSFRRTAASTLVFPALALAVAGCGESAPSPSTLSPIPSPTETAADLSAIACAIEDPDGSGELTGAWQGDDSGVYYIRQVGDCVWWFATELETFDGSLGQSGFANVATGRVNGAGIEVEWADLPMGDVLNGGGLSLVYDEQKGQLLITKQRGGGIPYFATTLTRIEPGGSPGATSGSPSSLHASPSSDTPDLSAIGCASEDPFGSGELTGAWSGTDGGVYYFRQVGECVWWFGTELREIEPGVTGQPGFANVASGRINGSEIELHWVDVPMGNDQSGGGLTLTFDSQQKGLVITEQQGEGRPFGAQAFSRIQPAESPDSSP